MVAPRVAATRLPFAPPLLGTVTGCAVLEGARIDAQRKPLDRHANSAAASAAA